MFAAGKALREALLAFVRLVEGADQHVAGGHIAVEPPSNADIFRALRHVVAAKSTSVSLLGSQLFAALLRSSPATEAVSRATYPPPRARAPAGPSATWEHARCSGWLAAPNLHADDDNQACKGPHRKRHSVRGGGRFFLLGASRHTVSLEFLGRFVRSLTGPALRPAGRGTTAR